MNPLATVCLLFFLLPVMEAHGQDADDQYWLLKQQLPAWTVEHFEKLNLDSTYSFSDFINPFYLEADFNGDGNLDIAIAVEQKHSEKRGIVILHVATSNFFVFGAGTSFGNGDDDFRWMDIWKVHRKLDAHELKFDSNSEIDESVPLKLKNPGLDVIKSESASGLIYWDGQQYKWAQTSD